MTRNTTDAESIANIEKIGTLYSNNKKLADAA
jgi:hypothetical protein